MRFQCVVKLAILVGVGFAQTFFSTYTSIDVVYAASIDERTSPFKPLLPPNDTNADDEERGWFFSSPAVDKAAHTLSTETLQKWAKERKRVSDVFTELNLAQTGEKLLGDPQFKTLIRYAKLYNKNNPQKVVSKVLALHYSDEILFKMLNEAKKNPDTKDVAVKLYAAKLRGWLDEKKTPDNIFAQLGLKTALSSVLTKPLFITYVDYVKLFNRENPGNKVWLLHPLLGSHSENYLIQLVDEAMKFPNTEKAIKIVQVELFQNWLRQKTSPDHVFAHFVFKNVMEGDNFLTNQNLKLWTKYLHDFNQRYPDRKKNMIDALRLSYSDEELAKALAQAINVPETEKLTSNLQLSLLNTWVRELKSPDEVSTILNLGSSNPLMKSYMEKFNWALAQISEKYFDDPRMWLKYVDYFRAKHPASEKSEIMILTDRYGDDIVAKMIAVTTTRRTLEYKLETFQKEHLQALKTAQVKGWYSSGKTPEDVFKLLHLDEAGNNLFDSPVLETWLNFAKKTVKYDRNLKKLEFDILNRSYGDERLSKILIAGKDTQFSSEANSLQKLQITAWLKSKKDVNDVYKWLMVKGTAKSNPERAVYKNYVERYSKEYLGGDTI